MARKQQELEGTRRADEPQPQKPIKALDDEIDNLEKLGGKRTRIGQQITESKKKIQALIAEHNLPFYEYEDANGVLKKKFPKVTLGSCKVKVEKRTDSESDDGDEE
ncbi:MAG: hypothetical protein ACM358_04950 [Gemmatimonadota bacterium]